MQLVIMQFSPPSHLVFLRSVRRLLVTDSAVPSSPILVTLMKEAQSSSETSVLTRATCVTSQKMSFFVEMQCVGNWICFHP
jgi:hypothetical protein